MRDRHLPRSCHACQAPMARQEDACWACGTDWPADEQLPVTRGTAAGGDRMRGAELRPRTIAVAVTAPVEGSPSSEADRWTNEGGRLRPDVGTQETGRTTLS